MSSKTRQEILSAAKRIKSLEKVGFRNSKNCSLESYDEKRGEAWFYLNGPRPRVNSHGIWISYSGPNLLNDKYEEDILKEVLLIEEELSKNVN